MLGEDEDFLRECSIEMFSEDGCLCHMMTSRPRGSASTSSCSPKGGSKTFNRLSAIFAELAARHRNQWQKKSQKTLATDQMVTINRDVMRCCAAEMAPHRKPPQIQQPKTAGANSKLDKTWGQRQGKVTISSGCPQLRFHHESLRRNLQSLLPPRMQKLLQSPTGYKGD